MTYGTGSQALANHIEDTYQQTRSGRPDVTGLASNKTGGEQQNTGVIVRYDRGKVDHQRAVHDLIHVYHPDGGGLDYQDTGYSEVNTVENLQIDIDLTNRSNLDTGERLNARDRLVGDRDDSGFPSDEDPPYPGILGEVVYVLETARRGLEEWDVARIEPLTIYLGHADASVSLDVGLEHIANNTVV